MNNPKRYTCGILWHGVNPRGEISNPVACQGPSFHKGIVIKTNANQRYATTPLTAALFREVCKRCEDFVVRNDSPCGSTIGPIISSSTGVRTIDVGAPQWAMHSCRETCASSDALHMLRGRSGVGSEGGAWQI
eukprot:s1743_g3.t1